MQDLQRSWEWIYISKCLLLLSSPFRHNPSIDRPCFGYCLMISQNYWPLRQGDFTEMTIMPDVNVQLQRKKWSCAYVPHFLYLSSFPLPTPPTHGTRLPVSICLRAISMLGTLCPESTFPKASDSSQSPLHTREIWLSRGFSSSDREKEKSGMKGRQPER